jgi:hypothetical protein
MNTKAVAALALLSSIIASSTLLGEETLKRRYPVSNAERPFTLPSQIVEVGITAIHTMNPTLGASITASYGATDNLQINTGYDAITLSDYETIESEKAFHLGLDYFLFESRFLSSMANVDFPLYIDKSPAQNIKFSFPTSIPISRAAQIGLSILQAGFINFTFVPYFGADINLPAKIGWQATEALSLALGTNFATFNINRPDGAGGFVPHQYIWTKTPIYLNALYGFCDSFDLTARIGFHDVQRNQGDNFYVWFGIAVRFGKMTE